MLPRSSLTSSSKQFRADERLSNGAGGVALSGQFAPVTAASHIPLLDEPQGLERWLRRDETARILWAVRVKRFHYVRLFT